MVVELKLLQALLSTGAKDVYRNEVLELVREFLRLNLLGDKMGDTV